MTGKSSLDKIVLLALILITIGSGALFFLSQGIKPEKTNRAEQFKNMANKQIGSLDSQKVSLDEMIINLYSRKTRLRFLNLKIDLEVFSPEQATKLRESKILINDLLIDIAGNMRPEELNSITGRILLESRLKKNLAQKLGSSIIKKIYFSKFIIQ